MESNLSAYRHHDRTRVECYRKGIKPTIQTLPIKKHFGSKAKSLAFRLASCLTVLTVNLLHADLPSWEESQNSKRKACFTTDQQEETLPNSIFDGCVVLKCRQAGMFSIFNDVLSLLHCFEQGSLRAIKVDFSCSGLYYEPAYGPNWWEYYCEPISYGESLQVPLSEVDGLTIPFCLPREEIRAYSKEKANELIQKYIRVKPHIKQRVEAIASKQFNTYIIGVHYRGTDKDTEAPRVPYDEVANQVIEVIKSRNGRYKIFIATDEIEFIKYMYLLFSNKIIYVKDAIRSSSNKPVHLDPNVSHYKTGEDALIDCLLLSKSNILIRTSSNLSLWSTYFNPQIPVINLNQRYIP